MQACEETARLVGRTDTVLRILVKRFGACRGRGCGVSVTAISPEIDIGCSVRWVLITPGGPLCGFIASLLVDTSPWFKGRVRDRDRCQCSLGALPIQPLKS